MAEHPIMAGSTTYDAPITIPAGFYTLYSILNLMNNAGVRTEKIVKTSVVKTTKIFEFKHKIVREGVEITVYLIYGDGQIRCIDGDQCPINKVFGRSVFKRGHGFIIPVSVSE